MRKLKKSTNLITIFEGMLPVYYYFDDAKSYERQLFSTTANDPMISELKRINGEKKCCYTTLRKMSKLLDNIFH